MNSLTQPATIFVLKMLSAAYIRVGFLQALEIMETWKITKKKFHAWKNHGI